MGFTTETSEPSFSYSSMTGEYVGGAVLLAAEAERIGSGSKDGNEKHESQAMDDAFRGRNGARGRRSDPAGGAAQPP
jgi:hypothetical protein